MREDVLLTEKSMQWNSGKILAGCGIEIISGLARGIDGMGQRGALVGGGRTFAATRKRSRCLLSAGTHRAVCGYSEPGRRNPVGISAGDALLCLRISLPGTGSSAVSQTQSLSWRQGKKADLSSPPTWLWSRGETSMHFRDRWNSELSIGCNRLIQQGAGLLLDPESLLNEWNFNVSGRTGKEDKNKKNA